VATWARGAAARMRSSAAAPLRGLRIGSTRSAPAAASLMAICSPSPSLAPVTTASFPAWSGISYVALDICIGFLCIGCCGHSR
jgi:hypothetical protein